MSRLSFATCDRALTPGDAPEWVHLFSLGLMKARDGREFDLIDPGALGLAFEASGVDLPVDYEHQNDNKAAKANGPIPAAGWIKKLEVRETGLWGQVEWTAAAREMISKREYRFLSPSFLYSEKSKQIVKLKGAGLVHNPALHLTALASEEDITEQNTGLLQKLADTLGLDASANADLILDAIRDLFEGKETPDPAKYVPIEALKDLMKDQTEALATIQEDRADLKVKKALESGYISPAMKGWATALCLRDETSFDTFLEQSPRFGNLVKPSSLSSLPPNSSNQVGQSPTAEAVCAQLGLKLGDLKNEIWDGPLNVRRKCPGPLLFSKRAGT